MILDTLAESAKRRVEERKTQRPLEVIRREAEALGADTGFPFRRALEAPGLSFICEVKKASPSRGIIAENFPYLKIAREYEAGGAAAISVLTEPEYFLGDDRYLAEIAEAVKIPVLRKDFTVDVYQIYEAKLLGASAVLLICTILSREQLREYLEAARSLGLSALTEAHDPEEIRMAAEAGAEIIGVNNRNLKDFQVDVENSLRLREQIPPGTLYVSESGIRTPEDVQVLKENGTDGVLIGEMLMRSPSPRKTLQALREGARHEN